MSSEVSGLVRNTTIACGRLFGKNPRALLHDSNDVVPGDVEVSKKGPDSLESGPFIPFDIVFFNAGCLSPRLQRMAISV